VKQNIYTIPLTEALREGECPFCYLLERTERDLIRLYLEGGLMEPDWRGRLLEFGLCGDHLKKLYHQSHRLGTAILVQSLLDQAGRHISGLQQQRKHPVLAGPSCLACSDLAAAFRHYADGFLTTLLREAEFRERAKRSGLCLWHLTEILHFIGSQRRFAKKGLEQQLAQASWERLQEVQRDLAWFIRKFDYRFTDEPWHGAEDALERSLRLLCGIHGDVGGDKA